MNTVGCDAMGWAVQF